MKKFCAVVFMMVLSLVSTGCWSSSPPAGMKVVKKECSLVYQLFDTELLIWVKMQPGSDGGLTPSTEHYLEHGQHLYLVPKDYETDLRTKWSAARQAYLAENPLHLHDSDGSWSVAKELMAYRNAMQEAVKVIVTETPPDESWRVD